MGRARNGPRLGRANGFEAQKHLLVEPNKFRRIRTLRLGRLTISHEKEVPCKAKHSHSYVREVLLEYRTWPRSPESGAQRLTAP
jgi:hypothetical protein